MGDEYLEPWLATLDPNKAKRMKAIWDGYTFDQCLTLRELLRKIIFVKTNEALLKRGDTTYAPRIVYKSEDEYNAVTGPFVFGAIKRFKSFLAQKHPELHFSYDDEVEKAWEHVDRRGIYVEVDFSSNDKTQTMGVARLGAELFKKLGVPDFIYQLELERQHTKVTDVTANIDYLMCGQMQSGITPTTMINSFWLMSIKRYCFVKLLKARHRTASRGDDGISVVWFPQHDHVDEQLRGYGYRVNRVKYVKKWMEIGIKRARMVGKITVTLDLRSTTFLSTHPLNCGGRWFAVPFLARTMCKIGVKTSYGDPTHYWVNKLWAYAYNYRHVPCVSALLIAHAELYDKPDVVELGYNSKWRWLTPTKIMHYARFGAKVSRDSYSEEVLDLEYLLYKFNQILSGRIVSVDPVFYDRI